MGDVQVAVVDDSGDAPVTQLATEAVAAAAELARVTAEYAAFRANVIKVGQQEASDRDWCDQWKGIALRMGIRADELPPTHAIVTVAIGDTTVSLRLAYDRNGKITPNQILSSLGEELRYGNVGQELRRSDQSWYTVTPEVPQGEDD
jgi:hypothetical protein